MFNMRTVLGIFLVLILTSMMVAVVGAQPQLPQQQQQQDDGNQFTTTGGGQQNCGWACYNPMNQQRHCDRWTQRYYCDRGHWSWTGGQRVWKCDSPRHWGWVCSQWNNGRSCNNWVWRCS